MPRLLQIKPARLDGRSLFLNPHDWSQTVIYEEIFVDGGYDLSPVNFRPEHVVDCGGHLGFFSLLASAAFPEARLTVFEPNPNNFARLQQNRAVNRLQWDCRLSAVGATAGPARLAIRHSNSARLSSEQGIATEVCDLAQFLKELAPASLLLKLDIEGEEKTIWPGLLPPLPLQCVVFFETHHHAEGWALAETAFREAGFEVKKTTDRGLCCDGYATRGPRPVF